MPETIQVEVFQVSGIFGDVFLRIRGTHGMNLTMEKPINLGE